MLMWEALCQWIDVLASHLHSTMALGRCSTGARPRQDCRLVLAPALVGASFAQVGGSADLGPGHARGTGQQDVLRNFARARVALGLSPNANSATCARQAGRQAGRLSTLLERELSGLFGVRSGSTSSTSTTEPTPTARVETSTES